MATENVTLEKTRGQQVWVMPQGVWGYIKEVHLVGASGQVFDVIVQTGGDVQAYQTLYRLPAALLSDSA